MQSSYLHGMFANSVATTLMLSSFGSASAQSMAKNTCPITGSSTTSSEHFRNDTHTYVPLLVVAITV